MTSAASVAQPSASARSNFVQSNSVKQPPPAHTQAQASPRTSMPTHSGSPKQLVHTSSPTQVRQSPVNVPHTMISSASASKQQAVVPPRQATAVSAGPGSQAFQAQWQQQAGRTASPAGSARTAMPAGAARNSATTSAAASAGRMPGGAAPSAVQQRKSALTPTTPTAAGQSSPSPSPAHSSPFQRSPASSPSTLVRPPGKVTPAHSTPTGVKVVGQGVKAAAGQGLRTTANQGQNLVQHQRLAPGGQGQGQSVAGPRTTPAHLSTSPGAKAMAAAAHPSAGGKAAVKSPAGAGGGTAQAAARGQTYSQSLLQRIHQEMQQSMGAGAAAAAAAAAAPSR